MSAAHVNNASAPLPASNDAAAIKSAMSLSAVMASPSEGDVKVDGSATPPEAVKVGNAAMLTTPPAERDATPGQQSTAGSSETEATTVVPYHGPVVREFTCMNDEFSECRTGQYAIKLSRKVISNHFGRNKACTREIKNWPLFCRKHYQRATYKPKLWQRRKVNLILRQFGVIEKEHPATTYKVSLKKSEMDRLNTFARLQSSGNSVEEAGAAVVPNPDIKSFQAPIDVLRELADYLGPKKTLEQVKKTLALINTMLRQGETDEVPSIEFLPEITITKPAEEKAAMTQGAKACATSRISAKGGVQKVRDWLPTVEVVEANKTD